MKFKKFASSILIAFLLNTCGPIAQAENGVAASAFLPQPGAMVHLSRSMNPPILKGIKVHADDPFRFDFILDKGDYTDSKNDSTDSELRQESSRLIKYFLASLTTPEGDLWVNLSPYEKDRIIPNSFGLTEMGRDLLAQDYMLKQITASLIYPEDELGKKFWKRIYEEAQAKYGTTNIPVNTFNKVWIVPDKAVVYENSAAIDGAGHTAYVVESSLKVMLEEDYLSLEKNIVGAGPRPAHSLSPGAGLEPARTDVNQLGSQIVKEIVIPALTREVNEGANFAQLRQVYNSLILATWYKKKIKDSILAKVYADQKKISGISIYDVGTGPRPGNVSGSGLWAGLGSAPTVLNVQTIYNQYLAAFKKGVYNYIKEEVDSKTQKPIPRKYFSGGLNLAMTSLETGQALEIKNGTQANAAMLNSTGIVVVAAFFGVLNAQAETLTADSEPIHAKDNELTKFFQGHMNLVARLEQMKSKRNEIDREPDIKIKREKMISYRTALKFQHRMLINLWKDLSKSRVYDMPYYRLGLTDESGLLKEKVNAKTISLDIGGTIKSCESMILSMELWFLLEKYNQTYDKPEADIVLRDILGAIQSVLTEFSNAGDVEISNIEKLRAQVIQILGERGIKITEDKAMNSDSEYVNSRTKRVLFKGFSNFDEMVIRALVSSDDELQALHNSIPEDRDLVFVLSKDENIPLLFRLEEPFKTELEDILKRKVNGFAAILNQEWAKKTGSERIEYLKGIFGQVLEHIEAEKKDNYIRQSLIYPDLGYDFHYVGGTVTLKGAYDAFRITKKAGGDFWFYDAVKDEEREIKGQLFEYQISDGSWIAMMLEGDDISISTSTMFRITYETNASIQEKIFIPKTVVLEPSNKKEFRYVKGKIRMKTGSINMEVTGGGSIYGFRDVALSQDTFYGFKFNGVWKKMIQKGYLIEAPEGKGIVQEKLRRLLHDPGLEDIDELFDRPGQRDVVRHLFQLESDDQEEGWLKPVPDGELPIDVQDVPIINIHKDGNQWTVTNTHNLPLSISYFVVEGQEDSAQLGSLDTAPDLVPNDDTLKADPAMKGGIDFNATQMNLQTRNDSGEVIFNLDPAMLRKFENASGFTPMILKIHPVTDLPAFLGFKPKLTAAEPKSSPA